MQNIDLIEIHHIFIQLIKRRVYIDFISGEIVDRCKSKLFVHIKNNLYRKSEQPLGNLCSCDVFNTLSYKKKFEKKTVTYPRMSVVNLTM